MKFTTFAKIAVNSAFSPVMGTIGCNSVFVKKENGICPQVGAKDVEGIFWPEDRVSVVNLPASLIKNYQR